MQYSVIALAACVVCFLEQTTPVSGHSWIACTDYLEENGEYWNQALCRAFPRHGHRYTARTAQFGRDTGYDKSNPPSDRPCRTQRSDDEAYDQDHPMAVYYAGQKVVITHPTKNHVADTRCTNKFIPDNGNRIWIGPRDVTRDVTLEEFQASILADLGVSPTGNQIADEETTQYPKPGFQNAPKFCENQDKALATNTFTVPGNISPGRYTLMWGWHFNSKSDLYTSCWEADIVASRTDRNRILSDRGLSTADLANTEEDTTVPVDSPTTKSPVNMYTKKDIEGQGVSRAGHVTSKLRHIAVLMVFSAAIRY